MKFRALLPLCFCSVSLACCVRSGAAQTATPTGVEKADLELWRGLRLQNAATAKTNPQQVAELYAGFLRAAAKQSPRLNDSIAIDAWDSTIDLVSRVVKSPEMALSLCDEALALYGEHPRAGVLLLAKMRVLVYEGRNADAQAFVEADWEAIGRCAPLYARRIMWQSCLALQAQGKREQIPATLQKIMVQNPALLGDEQQGSDGWMYRALVAELLSQGKTKEALSWAKLRWMETSFEDQKVQSAAVLLSQVWEKADEPKAPLGSLQSLLATPKGAAAPDVIATPDNAALNELSAMALPVTDAQELKARFKGLSSRSGQWSHAQKTHQRINLLILAGEWGHAMSEAGQLWMDRPTTLLGIQEIARVYKAHDLNLTRANAFLNWIETNQGPNPLEQFFAENPAVEYDARAVPKTIDPAVTIAEVNLNPDTTKWQSGEATLNDAVYELSAPEVLNGATEAETMRKMLFGLMIEHGDIPLSEALKNQETKRWVAYAYAAAGDKRAVPLFEDLLARIPQPAPDEAKAIDSMYLLMRLAGYYEKKGAFTQAAETELRARGYADGFKMPANTPEGQVPVAGRVANRVLEAARFYQRAGDENKTRQTYALVSTYGYGWTKGMALYDEALGLTDQGKYEEARRMLQQPVEGLYADQIKVALLTALGASYYRTGDVDTAQKYAQQAVESYAAIQNPLQGEGLQELVENSKQRLQWIERWKKAPVICTSEKLRFVVSPPKSPTETSPGPLQSLSFLSLKNIPLTITCQDPRIQVGAIKSGVQGEFSLARKVDIGIRFEAAPHQEIFDTVFSVQSPSLPNTLISVPIQVEITTSTK